LLAGAFEALLTPGFVQNDRSSIRQVQTSVIRLQRQPQDLIRHHAGENAGRQTARLRTEQKCIATNKFRVEERPRSLRGQRKYARILQFRQAVSKIVVFFDGRHLPIIEAGAADSSLVHNEAQRVHEMQSRSDVGTKSDDIARVRRDFRLIQDQMEHDN